VIASESGDEKLPYTGDGKVVNSPGYDGLTLFYSAVREGSGSLFGGFPLWAGWLTS
jgi:hypothetical protein